jgi:hypothetical protein
MFSKIITSGAQKVLLVLLIAFVAQTTTAADYGPWGKHEDWKGFEFRVRRSEKAENGKFTWWLEVRNNYQKTAHVSVVLTGQKESAQEGMFERVSIRPSQTHKSWFLLTDPSRVNAWIRRVRFGEDSGPYIKPDDRN